ncbi:MAG TPA: 2-amino-4-hydroxy-6-hydroxymethyldihydropteridine diphosphokinase [Mizugakiibacter sp.]|nr:2-amino-4-hydroxy-6-hydroxymethyldihydropteridine diphosphokinase [Mizugakiibacter sp.]
MKTLAYIGLGANLGNLEEQLRQAAGDLATLPDSRLLAGSRLYRSPPWGSVSQPWYLNAVVAMETGLTAGDLLQSLLAIERRHGRVRGALRYGPRTLDLDLLLYGEVTIAVADLQVPHPRMGERTFVLRPLAELAPRLQIPGLGSISELLAQLDDSACVPVAATLEPGLPEHG